MMINAIRLAKRWLKKTLLGLVTLRQNSLRELERKFIDQNRFPFISNNGLTGIRSAHARIALSMF